MIKPASLREALIATNAHLRDAPESLHLFIDNGNVQATAGRGNGWRYHYTLSLLVTDYAGHPDSLFAPLIAWLREHQPSLLLNAEKIEFETELLSDTTADVLIKLPLTESVVLREIDGKLTAEHRPEPKPETFPEGYSWELYVQGVHIEWPPASADDMNIPAWMR